MKQIIVDLTKGKQQITINEPTEIFGIFVGSESETQDLAVDVIHEEPELTSLTLVKAVLFGKSRFNFTGNIIIRTGAKHTDAYLKGSVLMLSKDARANVIPSLEIMENDVKGGHGATVGQVDEEQLFYLQSKGLTKSEALELLVNGFLQDIIDRIKDKNTAKNISEDIHKKLKSQKL